MLTIGFAYTQQSKPYHLAPMLFLNDTDLSHLEWITTLFPKEESTNNADLLNLQLKNYIEYHQKPLLIIGGDNGLLASIKEEYCVIDAREKIILHPARITVIINYDYTQDLDKKIFNQLKETICKI
jgi:hypothetical protein